MKASELKALDVAALEKKLADLRSELFNLRFQNAINQLDKPERLREVKKDIARILTELRARELQK